MKKLSFIREASIEYASVDKNDIELYIKKFNKFLPKQIILILKTLMKYDIYNIEVVESIKNSSSKEINSYADSIGSNPREILEIQKALKSLKEDIKYLPMYLTTEEWKDVMDGCIHIEDVTLDLESEKGRNAIAKKFAPLVNKIVNQFDGRVGSSKLDLTGAAYMGLTMAMNNFRKKESSVDRDNKDEEKKLKKQSFKQYAAWRIRYEILDEINAHSRVVAVTAYDQKLRKDRGDGESYSVSIDLDPDGEMMNQSFYRALQDMGEDKNVEAEDMKELYNYIRGVFAEREVDIFMSYFGLGTGKAEKGKDIAKRYNISAPFVTQTVKKIIDNLRSKPKAATILNNIRDIYTESVIYNCFITEGNIKERLLMDDLYIMLEGLTKWTNKNVLNKYLKTAFSNMTSEQVEFIKDCLNKGFDFMDSNYRNNRNVIIYFLSQVHPTEVIVNKSDTEILQLMSEIIINYK